MVKPATTKPATKKSATKKSATNKKTRVGANAATKAGGIGSAAVEKATGRSWDEWFAVLDRTGAKKMEHKAIAAFLHEDRGLSAWWSQMVTVGYERECLGRDKHQKADGYQVSASRTIRAPVSRLYAAWSDRRSRGRWLPEANFEVRKATREKSMRITWIDGATHVDAHFYAKADGKSQVTIEHKKLADRNTADRVKNLWRERLAALKAYLEK